MATTTGTTTVEVRYYTPGKGWGRRTFKTEAAFERWAEKLDEDIEVRVAQ